MRKLFVLVLSLAVMATLLVAPVYAEEQTVINMFYGTDPTGALKQIIEAFEEKYPQYKVNWVEAPASQDTAHDMLVTSLAAGESVYDVYSCNVIWPAEFSQAGYCLPIDRFIEADDVDLDDYSQGYVDAYTFQGKMWGMPWYGAVGQLYYRTDIIDTPPATWDELIEMAKAHMGENGTSVGYLMQAAQYEGLVCNALEFIASYGGTVVDGDGNITINNDGVRNALTMMKKIVDSGIVPENFSAFMENECQNMFANGDAVFMRTWAGHYASAVNPEMSKVAENVGGNFKHFRRDTALTALAGPAANVGITMLALMLHNTLLSLGAFWELPQGLAYLDLFFQYVAILSANLAVFNLLPIPPLDGSKVLYVILPRGICEKLLRYERFGFFLLAVLLWTGVLDAPLNFLRSGLIRLLWPICNWPVELLLHLFH